MSLQEKLKTVSDLMRQVKEEHIAGDPENTDVLIHIHVWRGDDLVVVLQCPLDRDTGLKAADMAARGFNATTVAITFESYHSQQMESPATGKPWQPQEMQYVFETDPLAAEKGWVNECLSTSIHDREGGCLMSSLAYVIKEGRLQWVDSDDWTEAIAKGGEPRGFMYQYLQQVMAAPTIAQNLETAAAGSDQVAAMLFAGLADDEERRTYHMDMATLHALNEKGLITAAAVAANEGSRREEWMSSRLEKDSSMTLYSK